MKNQKGMTLVELTLAMSVATVAVAASATYTLPWISRERARAAVYELQSYLQLTRIEAVSRNHQCRFVLDTSTHTLQIFDGKGTPATTTDDELLYETVLTDQVQFARPDTGVAVGLSQIGTSDLYETVFTADGSVSAGTGEVALYGGEEYSRLTVFGAGAVTVERWIGSGWSDGFNVTQATGGSGGSGGSGGGESGGGGEIPPDQVPIGDVVLEDPYGGGGEVDDGYVYDVY